MCSEKSGGEGEKKWSKKDLIFPVMAGAAYGLSHVFRKIGLNTNNEPILGLAIQNLAAVSFPLLFVFLRKGRGRGAWNNKRGWVIFALAGLLSIGGQTCLFYALSMGEVVVVSPLSAISPLFVLLIAVIFLGKLEVVTWKIILGAISIVIATVLLALLP